MKDYLVDALMEHFKESNPDAIKEIREYIDEHGEVPFRLIMSETDFAKYELREKLKKLEYIPNNAFSAIKKVYFNDPVTVVLWTDGTKTIVRAENEEYDPEKGLAMAIAKKALGNKGNYYNVFKRFLITDEDLESIGEGPRSSIDAIDEAYDSLVKAFGGKTE